MTNEDGELVRVLSTEADRLRARRGELERESERIAQELDQVRTRQDLVRALLEVLGSPVGKGRDAVLALLDTSARSLDSEPAGQARGNGAKRDVATLAYEILLARGKKPMYYEDLASEVARAGGHLGGTTPSQSLVARISRDQRFVRPEKRGWYAARDFYPKAKNVGARKSAPHSRSEVERRAKARRSVKGE